MGGVTDPTGDALVKAIEAARGADLAAVAALADHWAECRELAPHAYLAYGLRWMVARGKHPRYLSSRATGRFAPPRPWVWYQVNRDRRAEKPWNLCGAIADVIFRTEPRMGGRSTNRRHYRADQTWLNAVEWLSFWVTAFAEESAIEERPTWSLT